MSSKKLINGKTQTFLHEMSSVEEEQVLGGLKAALRENDNAYGVVSMNENSNEGIKEPEIPAWRISF